MAFDVNTELSNADGSKHGILSNGDLEQLKRWHADYLINKPNLSKYGINNRHLDWFLYPLLTVAIVLTVFFIVLLVVIIRKYKSNKTYLADHDAEILQLDKVEDSMKMTSIQIGKTNKYGTLENINETANSNSNGGTGGATSTSATIKPSSSWPFHTFLLRNILPSKTTKQHKTEYSLSKFDENDGSCKNLQQQKEVGGYRTNHHAEMILNNELISKLTPIKLNYSVKYENKVLKIDVISIEMDKITDVAFNPYVRIELINEDLRVKEDLKSINNSDDKAFLNDEDESQFKICKTRVIRNALHPVYNETFVFKNIKSLIEFKLVLSVYSSNRFTRDLFIGQLIHEFEVIDEVTQSLQHSYSKELVYENNESLNDKHNTGEITVSLCYKTSSKTLYVNLIKANYLPYVNKNNLPNPFAKIFLTYNGEHLSKKLGKIFMQTRAPTLNETFEFDLSKYLTNSPESSSSSSYKLEEFGILIILLDWNPIEKCDQLGELNLCNNKGSIEVEEICSYWNSVFEKQNEPVLATYKLASSPSSCNKRN